MANKQKQAHVEVPPQIQMEAAMRRLGDTMKDHVTTSLGVTAFVEHKNVPAESSKTHFSHLISFQKKKIINNIEDLRHKSIAIVGLSSTGALVAEMFTRTVKMSSMGRMYYLPDQVGMSKAQASRLHLRRLNPHVNIDSFHCDILDELDCDAFITTLLDVRLGRCQVGDDASAPKISTDLIICCLDNSVARLKMNQIALKLNIHLIDISLSPCNSYITIHTIFPGFSACMECHWNAAVAEEAALADAISQLSPAALPQSELLAAGLVSQCAMKLLLEYGEIIPFYRVDCLDVALSTYLYRPNSECANELCKSRQNEHRMVVAK
ncbi:hypothetical protein THRCLA_23011 [Thraustotheca clavata]|uniref:Ubiquitin-like modifier-activating enzyme 5 n=1 Tax=Thraustotheca clavata TaxID=74557 RepID=A0A1V9YJ04_9STRA|nr:hypothetical protein THRCLA_23011 [Thraustotheca clavata]